MNDETITISVDKYNQLLKDSKTLSALYAGGVDNWDWYYESLEQAGLVSDYELEDDF